MTLKHEQWAPYQPTADVVWGNEEWDMKAYEPAPQHTARLLISLLLQGDLSRQARALVEHAAADDMRKALQLILQCPEYQLN
jgi:hypothetical protein